MERYLLTILLTNFLVAFAEKHRCEHKNIQVGESAEIKCNLPASCTRGVWTKTVVPRPGEVRTKTLSANNCSRCEGKFNVTDHSETKGESKTFLKFLHATGSVGGTYTCSCENSPQNSNETTNLKCYTISVYVDCHIQIAIDNAEMVIQGNSLAETTLHTLVATEGAKVQFRCSNHTTMKTSENCTEFENDTKVTMNKSYNHCKVICMRKEHRGSKDPDACRLKVLLNVDDSDSVVEVSSNTRGLYWSILVINVIVLSIFCGIFLYRVYFRKTLAQRASARKRENHTEQSLYATVAPASGRRDARSVQTSTSTHNTTETTLGETEQQTNNGINPYLVSGAGSYSHNVNSFCPGGDSVDMTLSGHGIKSTAKGIKGLLEGYTPMTSPNSTLERPKPDEIDLYFFEEYSSIPEL